MNNNNADQGFVYLLSNPAMPNLIKIGKTTQDEPQSRVSSLYTTGVPVPFDIEYACRVENATEVENALHLAFEPQRINPRREFFEIQPEQAIAILKLLKLEDATEELKGEGGGDEIQPQDTYAAARLRKKRRPNLNFDEMGIPVGATLQSLRTDETATVVEARKVNFRDQESISLTAASKLMLDTESNVRGTSFWSYNGTSLDEIYEDTYE